MSDAMAIGAMHAPLEHGLGVPGDVSVVGFDDIDLAAHVEPPLTTVHQPIRQKVPTRRSGCCSRSWAGRAAATADHRLLWTPGSSSAASSGPVRVPAVPAAPVIDRPQPDR